MDNTSSLNDALRQHERAVFTYFRRLGVQPADAADLAQTTFVRALRGIERFRGDSSVKTWLLGIARNVFREWLRDKHRGHGDLEGIDPATADRSADLDVLDVLGRLDVETREVLVLRHVMDLSNQEIAALLGISDAAVRQRVSRAAADFREIWSKS